MILQNILRSLTRRGMIVRSAFTQSLDVEHPSIVFMPEGEHTITASVDGKPQTITVTVDPRVLASFTEDLGKRKESNIRPFGGFDHEKGAASFIPLEFRYEDGVGLMLDVEWTKAGREAIEGKDYSYFSPSFLVRNGIPFGLPKRGEVGSLVNDPAFEDIPRIAASNSQHNSDIMEHLVKLGLVSSDTNEEEALVVAQSNLDELKEKAEKAEEASEVQAAEEEEIEVKKETEEEAEKVTTETASPEEELADMKIAYAKLKEEYNAAMEKLNASSEAAAAAAVEDAVAAGRIAPQDEDAKAFWKQSIIDKPESSKVLASMQAAPVLDGTTILAGRSDAREMSKEIPRSEFDALKGGEKLAFVKAGGTIVDDVSQ